MKNNSSYRFVDPLNTFIICWIFYIFLYHLGLLNYYSNLNTIFIVLMIYIAVVGLLVKVRFNADQDPPLGSMSTGDLALKSKVFFYLFWSLFLIEIFISSNLPLTYLVYGGSEVLYSNFGNPWIHPFVIISLGIYMLIRLALAILKPSLFNILTYAFYLMIPLILVNRALFIMYAIQSFCLIFLLRKINLRSLALIFLIILGAVFVFGFFGNLRVGSDLYYLKDLKNNDLHKLFSFLPSGVLWAYKYITGGIHNFNAACNINIVIDHSYTLHYTFETLIPSQIRDKFYNTASYLNKYPLPISNNISNNTFTYLARYYRDGGFFYVIFFNSLIFIFCYKIYNLAKINNLFGLLSYPVVYSSIVLTFFHDYFTTLVIIIQYLFMYLFFKGDYLVNDKI